MGIEQHLLALARIGPDIGCARVAETHMRHLHPHRLAGDLHILVAPVELVGLTRLEGHRDERRCAFASILPPLRSEEHTSELQSLMRNSYAVFCLKKKTNKYSTTTNNSKTNTKQNRIKYHHNETYMSTQ